MARLIFGTCRNCGHQIAKKGSESNWLHHITRSRLLNLPHWPSGHVLTLDCKWKCDCKIAEVDQTKPVTYKYVYLGRRTDR